MIEHQQTEVDFWLAETISSIAEGKLIKACTAMTNKPTWISLTIKDQLMAQSQLRSGELVYEAVQVLAGQHVEAILFNCSCVEVMEHALIHAKQALIDLGIEEEIQLGVYANAFPPIGELHEANNDAGISSIREDISPDKYAQFALSWLQAGASIIGGCCGVSPEHIKQLASLKSQSL